MRALRAYQRDLSAHKMSQGPPVAPRGAPEGRRRFSGGLFERQKNAPGSPRSFHAE